MRPLVQCGIIYPASNKVADSQHCLFIETKDSREGARHLVLRRARDSRSRSLGATANGRNSLVGSAASDGFCPTPRALCPASVTSAPIPPDDIHIGHPSRHPGMQG